MVDACSETILSIHDLAKVYSVGRGRSAVEKTAVTGLSFRLQEGSSLGIVGESGAGKSTVARLLLGLEVPTRGYVEVAGSRVTSQNRKEQRLRGRQIQMVFQDPHASLDRRQEVGDAVDEVLRLHFDLSRDERRRRITGLFESVGLGERHMKALPRELSGGQCQRAAIVRALAVEPKILVLDEPVAALDVSIQAQILNLLDEIRRERNVSYIVISHDLGVIRHSTEEIIVMRSGKVVESGGTVEVIDQPKDEYTQALLAAVPRPGWNPGWSRGTNHERSPFGRFPTVGPVSESETNS